MYNAVVLVKVTQSCPTVCHPKDYTVLGFIQDRILEWVAIPFSREPSQPRDQPRSPALQVDSLSAELPGKPGSGIKYVQIVVHPSPLSPPELLHHPTQKHCSHGTTVSHSSVLSASGNLYSTFQSLRPILGTLCK